MEKSTVINLKEEPIKKELFSKTNNLITKLREVTQSIHNEGQQYVTAGDIMSRIVDNQIGFNIIEFCHNAGITVNQLKNFIENNGDELGYQHDPSRQKQPTTRAQEVTLSMVISGTKLESYKGKTYIMCANCNNKTYPELPVCPYCGTKVVKTEQIASIIEAIDKKERETEVVFDDGDVCITKEDLRRGEEEYKLFRKQLHI